jgi:hypothetical protein
MRKIGYHCYLPPNFTKVGLRKKGSRYLSCGASTGAINRHNAQNAPNQFSSVTYLIPPFSATTSHNTYLAISQD